MRTKFPGLLFLSLFIGLSATAQEKINLDESLAGEYVLPSVLTMNNGDVVKRRKDWTATRRKEVLQLFQENVYGKMPGRPQNMHFKVRKIDHNALDGMATSKQVRIYFTAGTTGPYLDLLLFAPRHTKKPVPVFVGLNFRGNQSISSDSTIEISANYRELLKIKRQKADKIPRGDLIGRWEAKEIIDRGFALATAYYGDVEQDHTAGWKTGIRTSLQQELNIAPAEWSGIGAWAWSLSRILDYLETDGSVDASKAIVLGHSRLGKTALWAGANDTRFAGVISNNSGEAGAALARRRFGETTKIITGAFPHWFISKFRTFADDANALPVDQHMLLALIAPRPLYVASATQDEWADPKGEFLGAKHAEPVYALFKKKGLGVAEMPRPDQPVGHTIRYHLRTGKHDVVLYDWIQYLRFADEVIK